MASPLRRLAGRCACGLLLEMAWDDEHLQCSGLSWCKRCYKVVPRTEFHPQRRVCAACRRVSASACLAKRMADPAYAEAKRAYDRQRKRDKWELDPEWRAAHIKRTTAYTRQWRQKRKHTHPHARCERVARQAA